MYIKSQSKTSRSANHTEELLNAKQTKDQKDF